MIFLRGEIKVVEITVNITMGLQNTNFLRASGNLIAKNITSNNGITKYEFFLRDGASGNLAVLPVTMGL